MTTSISGITSNEQVTQGGTINPFSNIIVTDTNPDGLLAVFSFNDGIAFNPALAQGPSITITATNLTELSGIGNYEINAVNAADLQAYLRSLTFSTSIIGSTSTFLELTDVVTGQTISSATTTIQTVAPPTITGLSSPVPQVVETGSTIKPFSSTSIADSNFGGSATLSVAITLTNASGNATSANGVLAGVTGLSSTGPGIYTLTGSVSTINNDLQNLVFEPVAAADETSTATNFALTVTDTQANISSSASTSVYTLGLPTPPTITDTTVNPITVDSGSGAINPFGNVTINDPWVQEGPFGTETGGGSGSVTVTLSSSNGSTNLGTLTSSDYEHSTFNLATQSISVASLVGIHPGPLTPPETVLQGIEYIPPTLAAGTSETIDATVSFTVTPDEYDGVAPQETVTDATPVVIVVNGPTASSLAATKPSSATTTPPSSTPTTAASSSGQTTVTSPTTTTPASSTTTSTPIPTVTLGAANSVYTAAAGQGTLNVQGTTSGDSIAVSGVGYSQTAITDVSGGLTIALNGTTINASGLAQVSFIDGTETYDPSSVGAEVVRLYQAALGRAPDAPGLASWVQAINQGTSLTTVAAGFLGSPEFQARFPGTGNPTTFVDQLYQNVLGRAPDASGLANWVAALTAGGQSQAQVLAEFAQSAENINDTAPLIQAGVFVPNEDATQVARLYYATLDRAPDIAGLTGWTSALMNGSENLTQVATGFINSPEFQATYGALNNAQFVTLLYQNVLGRAPDAAGFANWENALNSGTSRASVVLGFSESTENVSNLAPVIDNNGIKFIG